MAERGATIAGVGLLRFGRHPGKGPIELMAEAADLALADAGVARGAVDALVTGYATTLPHLMLADLFAEHYGLTTLRHAHAIQAGGASGAMLILLARHLIAAGAAETILVVAGENRLTGQSRDDSIRTLANVGHAALEVPTGATVPAYYALAAARYLHETGASDADLAELAVLMRRHARGHPGAHLTKPIEVAEVLASKPIATPLKLLDCCPISDGACAFVVRRMGAPRDVAITGYGEGHTHQHLSAAPDDLAAGARLSADRAFAAAGRTRAEIDALGIYDSFTATLALLIEATGFAASGEAGRAAREGRFAQHGPLPMNLHGGLLSYGHCGVAGGMAMIAETVTQIRHEAGARQGGRPRVAFVHADGGVLSSNISLILERAA